MINFLLCLDCLGSAHHQHENRPGNGAWGRKVSSRVSFKTSFDSKQNVCFGCFASIPKQRFSMFRLNRNTNRRPTKTVWLGAYFAIFYRKFKFFPVFKVFFIFFSFFRFVSQQFFQLYRFYTETESFNVSIEPKQTVDPPKQFEREYIWVFSENFGLFWFVRFVTKQLFVSDVSI